MEFLDYYAKNLTYIRSHAAAFAKEYPKIASRLDLSQFECEDPFIERLLEGTAFLAAKVEQQIDLGFPKMLESLLFSLSSRAMYPTPSVAIAKITPDYSSDCIFDSNDMFEFNTSVDSICKYTPLWSGCMSAFEVNDAKYISDDEFASAISIKLDSYSNNHNSDFLDFYISATDSDASLIISSLMTQTAEILIKTSNGITKVENFNFSLNALNKEIRSQRYFNAIFGLLNLQEYFAYPNLFRFIRLSTPKVILNGNLEIIIILNKKQNIFKNIINNQTFNLNVLPLINIFKMRSDRQYMQLSTEYCILADMTNARDYEVYDVLNVDFYNSENKKLFSAKPFYYTDDEITDKYEYFVLYRKDKNIADNKRSNYLGQDVFVSFSGNKHKDSSVKQIGADILCTNRDLPLFLKDMDNGTGKNVKNIRLIQTPSRPRKSIINKDDWKKLSHIMLNLSSILWSNVSLKIIKDIVKSYSILSEEESERICDSILEIKSVQKTFRFLENHSIFYEQGWSLDVKFSERKIQDIGYFPLACALWSFLQSLNPINSHLQMNLFTEEQGFITKWTTLKE